MLGLSGFLVINGWGLATVDAGSPEVTGFWQGLAWVVNGVLLQPFAYWLLEVLALAWWTWGGLALLAAIILFNTSALAILAYWLAVQLRSRAWPGAWPGQ